MKNLLIFLISVILCGLKTAAIDYKKFIEKHDVDEGTMNLRSDNPLDFWESFIANNETFHKFLRDIENGKGKDAQNRIAKFPRFNTKYRPEVMSEMSEMCNNIANAVGKATGIEMCIIDNDSFNAFSAYTDEGMAVVLNHGILTTKGITPEIIIGIAAHEYAHCWLFHILQSEHSYSKRKHRDKAIAGIAAGLSMIATAADAYTSANIGTESNAELYVDQIEKLEADIKEDLFKYYYRYAREQEYEADLIAYRFMEWAGYGGENYIEALKIFEANNDFLSMKIESEDDDTHPTIRERILFLTFVRDNPDIKNTQNEKIKKKRKIQDKFGNDDIYN